jgi:hypothetical protein
MAASRRKHLLQHKGLRRIATRYEKTDKCFAAIINLVSTVLNKAVIYDLLFKASAETLSTIAADPKRLMRHARQRTGPTLSSLIEDKCYAARPANPGLSHASQMDHIDRWTP